MDLLKSIYSLDTLDTRFTNPSTVPYKPPASGSRLDAAATREPPSGQDKPQPPKWNTPEFYLYYLVFLFAVPMLFWVPYNVSKSSDPRYEKFQQYLTDGWIPGRKIDVSDSQYHTFRSNLPYMAILIVVHPFLRRAWNALHPISSREQQTKSIADQGAVRLEQRASYDYAFALVFLVALHGFSAAKVLLILYANYRMAKGLPRKSIPAATWVANICILFANELGRGYHFRDIASLIASPATGKGAGAVESPLIQWGAWLDSYGGLMNRWEILFNITILRLISFNLDYYWSLDRRAASPEEKKQLDPANLSEKDRINIPAAAGDYSFRNYVAYAIYAPLYLTGPILTFNDYIAQLKHRAASIETPRTIRYAVRFVFVLLAMELVLHYDYIGAISKADPDWSSYSAAQLSILSLVSLHIIWLKLLLPWRLFRLWALVDGIDPPENMIRCVSNNYSTLSFWRAWHRSYYRWLLRYIYVPLGGSSFRTWKRAAQSVLTYLMVFTFVALWHDIQMRLLIWGWLVVLFFMPEVLATMLFPKRKWETRPTAYRMLSGVGGVLACLMMMVANLVGFAVGIDGLQSIVQGVVHEWSGVLFFITACLAVFVAVQIMFEMRAQELRQGIALKC